jgi:arylsulfatase A-like enzyme
MMPRLLRYPAPNDSMQRGNPPGRSVALKHLPRASLSLLFLVLTACLNGGAAGPAEQEETPNVLLVVADDMRADMLEDLPELTGWLVDGGTLFREAYATTPECCPSRASMMTGQLVHNHGVLSNVGNYGDRLPERETIQRYLDDRGYLSALFGKFLNGWTLSRTPRFFDEWAFFLRSSRSYAGGNWNVDGKIRTVDEYYKDFVQRRTLRFLERSESNDDRPWFLYLAPAAVHTPAVPERRFEATPVPPWEKGPAVGEDDVTDKWPRLYRKRAKLKNLQQTRAQQIRAARSLETLMTTIKGELNRLNEDDRTLVIFVSDQGYLWGEHLLRGKEHPYVESIHVPFVVRWPGHVEEGAIDDRLASTIDVAPTILDAAGVDEADRHAIDGISLLGVEGHRRLVLEHISNDFGRPAWSGLLAPSFQFIEYYERNGSLAFSELYDLRRDPAQLDNLMETTPRKLSERAQRLHQMLTRDQRCAGATCP